MRWTILIFNRHFENRCTSTFRKKTYPKEPVLQQCWTWSVLCYVLLETPSRRHLRCQRCSNNFRNLVYNVEKRWWAICSHLFVDGLHCSLQYMTTNIHKPQTIYKALWLLSWAAEKNTYIPDCYNVFWTFDIDKDNTKQNHSFVAKLRIICSWFANLAWNWYLIYLQTTPRAAVLPPSQSVRKSFGVI